MINYVIGDALDNPTDGHIIIPQVNNDIGGWGRGFVVAISNQWEKPERMFREWASKGVIKQMGVDVPYELGNTQFVRVTETICIANMVAQKGIHNKPIRYRHLANCMHQVGDFCCKFRKHLDNIGDNRSITIRAPKFGAGLAEGNWQFIEQLITEIWINEFSIPTTVCTLESK